MYYNIAEYIRIKRLPQFAYYFLSLKKILKKSIRFAISMRMDGYLLQVNVTFCYEGNVMG